MLKLPSWLAVPLALPVATAVPGPAEVVLASGLRATNLRCEYRVNPLGVDTPRPRLSWVLESERRGEVQTAYRVLVASDAETLAKGQGDLWDSGKVASARSAQVEYAGRPLAAGQRVFWKVRLWGREDAPSPWSAPAYWQTGLPTPADWHGEWISADEAAEPGFAAILLRKTFQLAKPVVRATASVCGLGYHELFLNGQRIGDHQLDPGFTRYDRRLLYVTHDVTGALRPGENALGVRLGGGWYRLATPDLFGFQAAPWTAPPKLLLQLDLVHADGTTSRVVSDRSWKWATGEITFNCVRGGETHDLRLARPGWTSPAYADADWHAVVVQPPLASPSSEKVGEPNQAAPPVSGGMGGPTPAAIAPPVSGGMGGPNAGPLLCAQKQPPIKATREIRAVALTEPKPGVYVYKLAENIAGWVRFRTSGPAGHRITLRFNETLAPDGTLSNHLSSHTHGRYQTGELILAGNGEEVYEPRFTYHGFQYVQVEGLTRKPALSDLVGVAVHTALEPAAEFACSHEWLNALHRMCRRTYLNNLHSIPTDCPQREKMGWLADGAVASDMAMWAFDAATFYTKWTEDLRDAAAPNGSMPAFVPTCGWGEEGQPGHNFADAWWGGATVLVPWNLYRHYGDTRLLREHYPAMRRYVDYLGTRAQEHLLTTDLGDWLAIDMPPKEVTATLGYCYFARLVARTAAVLGNTADAERYDRLAEAIRDAFNARYFDAEAGRYRFDMQSALAMALYFGLPPDGHAAAVQRQLGASIEEKGRGQVSTGIVGTEFLLKALQAAGRDDVAYRLVTAHGYPGWFHMLASGSTTVWEAWHAEGLSQNHPALACVDAWLTQVLAGIRLDPETPGFRKVILRPYLAEGLTWVRGSHRALTGEIASYWRRDGRRLTWEITLPANTTATVYVPAPSAAAVTESGRPASQAEGVRFLRQEAGAAVFAVGAGRYRFVVR